MRAVTSDDSQDGSIRTMTRISGLAELAESAACVDLADDSNAPCQGRCGVVWRDFCRRPSLGHLFKHANELMTQRSLKPCVAARYFQISVANARQGHAHQSLAGSSRSRDVCNRNVLILTAESFHFLGRTELASQNFFARS